MGSIRHSLTHGSFLTAKGLPFATHDDIIVADTDGVAVVPRVRAEVVAAAARKILNGDKAGRRGLYKKLGWPEDFTVM